MSTEIKRSEVRNIRFDAGPHVYTDEYHDVYTSMTQVLSQIEPVFDKEYWAWYKALERSGYTVKLAKDRQISVKIRGNDCKYSIAALHCNVLPTSVSYAQILKEWDDTTEESCIWGTERHGELEGAINSVYDNDKIKIHDIQFRGFKLKINIIKELEDSDLKNLPPAIYQRLEIYIKNGWTLYAEKRVYHSYYKIAGTIDLLLVKNKQIVIFDWKTNKHKLEFRSGYYKKDWNKDRTKKVKTSEFVEKDERFLSPLNHIKKSKGNGYTLQLSGYGFLCECWDFQFMGAVLVHLRPELDEDYEPKLINGKRIELPPEFYNIEYRKSDIKKLFEWHRNKTIKSN
jgi:hypothetical protein